MSGAEIFGEQCSAICPLENEFLGIKRVIAWMFDLVHDMNTLYHIENGLMDLLCKGIAV